MMTTRSTRRARIFGGALRGIPPTLALVLVLGVAPDARPLQDEPVVDPPAVAAAREAYRAASEAQSAAQAELETLVLDLEDDYVLLSRSGRAATLRNALAVALHDGLEAAAARIVAREGQLGRRVPRGMRREILVEVLREPATKATALDPRLAEFVVRRVADDLSSLADLSGASKESILAVISRLFDADESWAAFWNRSFREDLDAARRYAAANDAVQEAWLVLDQVLHPERYGPRGEAVPTGMVVVPGGTYRLGPNTGLQRVQRTVTLDSFALDRREVTQREYAAFVTAQPPSARAALLPRGWRIDDDGRVVYDEDRRDHPVVFVSWTQAHAFAAWHGKRLPTEDEWEAAAAGPEGRAYPWGDEFQMDAANGGWGPRTTMPVESFPRALSAARCFDMAGNVWEWTSTTDDGVNVTTLPEGYVSMVIRGGGFDSSREELASRHRWTALGEGTFGLPTYTKPIGFRCAKSLR